MLMWKENRCFVLHYIDLVIGQVDNLFIIIFLAKSPISRILRMSGQSPVCNNNIIFLGLNSGGQDLSIPIIGVGVLYICDL